MVSLGQEAGKQVEKGRGEKVRVWKGRREMGVRYGLSMCEVCLVVVVEVVIGT